MTSKFGEIKINSIGPGIQVLRRDNFDNKITEVFRIDGNRFNQPARLATFDSIHDFKTFGTNPTDTIEYQRKDGKYNINKCFFNTTGKTTALIQNYSKAIILRLSQGQPYFVT